MSYTYVYVRFLYLFYLVIPKNFIDYIYTYPKPKCQADVFSRTIKVSTDSMLNTAP